MPTRTLPDLVRRKLQPQSSAVRFPHIYTFEQGQGGTFPAAAALSVGRTEEGDHAVESGRQRQIRRVH